MLRGRGVPAFYGDATTRGVLQAAGVGTARLIVIATPEGYQTRRIIELARELDPTIDTAVRTHIEAEIALLEQLGIGSAIMGERELAFSLTQYALAGDGGVYERRLNPPPSGAPELRRHAQEKPLD